MLGKLLGILDVISGMVVILAQYGMIPFKYAFSFAAYLILKMIIFRDSLSFIDGAAGVYMMLVFLWHFEVVSFIFAIYLIIKGFGSVV